MSHNILLSSCSAQQCSIQYALPMLADKHLKKVICQQYIQPRLQQLEAMVLLKAVCEDLINDIKRFTNSKDHFNHRKVITLSFPPSPFYKRYPPFAREPHSKIILGQFSVSEPKFPSPIRKGSINYSVVRNIPISYCFHCLLHKLYCFLQLLLLTN